jgi:hypothetical protein
LQLVRAGQRSRTQSLWLHDFNSRPTRSGERTPPEPTLEVSRSHSRIDRWYIRPSWFKRKSDEMIYPRTEQPYPRSKGNIQTQRRQCDHRTSQRDPDCLNDIMSSHFIVCHQDICRTFQSFFGMNENGRISSGWRLQPIPVNGPPIQPRRRSCLQSTQIEAKS